VQKMLGWGEFDMKKFYEINTHDVCDRILLSVYKGEKIVVTQEELYAIATKMLWLEQDYANIRSLATIKMRSENSYKNYRLKRGKSNIDKILDMAAAK